MQLIGCRNNEILNRIPATVSFVLIGRENNLGSGFATWHSFENSLLITWNVTRVILVVITMTIKIIIIHW